MNDIPGNNDSPASRAADVLAAVTRSGTQHRWRKPLAVTAAVAFVLAVLYAVFNDDGSGQTRYLTQVAERGALTVKVSATGQLEPTHQVEVGSELSGTIAAVLVDDDDRVSKGQVLARLDLSKFEDAVAKSRATRAVAQAALRQAQATVVEVQARLERYREVARLSGGKVPSKTEMETAEAERARAQANVASAEAGIAQADAALRTDETNLGKASIRSPIDGVVLERAVDPGQTVAASLQAVTLFTLAEDLSKMELKVDVDEADVGQVKAGLDATFTVDAWPGRRFQARIVRVGYNASDDSGVVSYPAVLQVANDDLSLRPGMTGTAEITTLAREDVLLVPNAALRFSPSAQPAANRSGSVVSALMPRPPAPVRKVRNTAGAEGGDQQVWVLRSGEAVAVQVRTGASNGRVTEIVGGEIEAGMAVITEAAITPP
ncbi:MAG: efflux RND transporter periplasmic adaptor subunit [Sinimarinibacterium sp.]|jgi:HlyD family secretion protein